MNDHHTPELTPEQEAGFNRTMDLVQAMLSALATKLREQHNVSADDENGRLPIDDVFIAVGMLPAEFLLRMAISHHDAGEDMPRDAFLARASAMLGQIGHDLNAVATSVIDEGVVS